MSLKRVLIVGGTGYLGQHLLQSLRISPLSLAYTYNSEPPPQLLFNALPDIPSFRVDMRTGDGFGAVSNLFGQPDVVINCAAISVPRACEMDQEAAMAINVPTALVDWLLSFKVNKTLLIHLSTDQVYEGTKSFYKEEDDVVPVNVYGKSKVEAERYISAKYPNFAILRSSIIYGPQTIAPLPKSLPIQWMDSVLAKGEALDFFLDEFRCPVYVKDLVNVIRILIDQWISEHKQMRLLLNVGGPDRVSRVQMAEAVANVRGYSTALIKQVSASSVDRGVKSPADISMDITKLIQTLGVTPTSYTEGVTLTLHAIPCLQRCP
ncbi:methionine adenosyltransferase 2 subunit beta [Dorcoceras hygrometricum]|uniref:Methionine adenosyltransferase 2 subunit beta n=1 Tax=Dorcoceras hygrometricum TaxID=472368 RepID=A0A2Z7AJD4_9LAMI|nr:methionine adenosyltransferase 2 subunit beta [Dorcoceras hygrometricum]